MDRKEGSCMHAFARSDFGFGPWRREREEAAALFQTTYWLRQQRACADSNQWVLICLWLIWALVLKCALIWASIAQLGSQAHQFMPS
eukprot:347586-Pelagomonas_calceolata.AAC.2